MTDWLDALQALGREQQACVIVTVAQVLGSAPRDAGTKMLVTAHQIMGTIGGGHLEFRAIELARRMLSEKDLAASELHRFALGPSLGQCCGGVVLLQLDRIDGQQPDWVQQLHALGWQQQPGVLVSAAGRPGGAAAKVLVTADAVHGALPGAPLEASILDRARRLLADQSALPGTLLFATGEDARRPNQGILLERIGVPDFQIVLFGAGHVGRALVHILAALPCRITWVDTREQPFPDAVPAHVQVVESEDPVYEVRQAPPGSYFLVLTHSHALDYALCEAILARQDFRFFGLIGSTTKRNQFERRLLQKGFTPAALQMMTCPIGVPGIKDKHPAAIAVAVVAQVLQVHEQAQQTVTASAGARISSL